MFQFKQFTITQRQCAMKVGTDGVLLGAWVNLSGDESRILDIGSGTGLLSLMLAQRCNAQITGVEIDTKSYEESCENLSASPWSDRVEIVNSAIQSFEPRLHYELIVSNPPFFTSSLKSPNASRSVARHCDSLPFEELIKAVCRLLCEDGRFVIILPTNQSHNFDMKACGELYLTRRCSIITEAGKEAKRYISEYSLKPSIEIVHEELIIRRNGEYSDEYKALTAPFYKEF